MWLFLKQIYLTISKNRFSTLTPGADLGFPVGAWTRFEGGGVDLRRKHFSVKMYAGCQPKTFKTFILMVKPLKPLFFSEKPLKTFI